MGERNLERKKRSFGRGVSWERHLSKKECLLPRKGIKEERDQRKPIKGGKALVKERGGRDFEHNTSLPRVEGGKKAKSMGSRASL